MYDAQREYDRGLAAMREGNPVVARVAFDSVIAKTDRVVRDHPDSKYAAPAVMLKVRSEIYNRRWEAAAGTAARALELSADSTVRALADGFLGMAAYNLEEPTRADSLLTVALAGPIGADDRALFLFNRGLARLELGRPGPAAEDLQTASRQIDLSDEARRDLALALTQIGQYEEAAKLTAQLLQANRFGNLTLAQRAQIDTLSRRAPAVADTMLADLLRVSDTEPTMIAMLYFLRGRARQQAGDTEAALRYLDSAVAAAATSRYAADASYYAARQRLREATRTEVVSTALTGLLRAQASVDPEVRVDAARLHTWAQRFVHLMEAYESRGAAAAEAVLRAAEVAGTELDAAALARGLYLLYLDLAPDSRWAAKAIYGALAYAGHPPGDWVEDRGEETDRELLARLAALPEDDPYRLAVEERGGEYPLADSMYLLAEADLKQRIQAIRMLFDPEAGIVVVEDTAAAQAADTTGVAGVPAQPAF
jgi:tetratricopeptide (TPR) repeat protein